MFGGPFEPVNALAAQAFPSTQSDVGAAGMTCRRLVGADVSAARSMARYVELGPMSLRSVLRRALVIGSLQPDGHPAPHPANTRFLDDKPSQ